MPTWTVQKYVKSNGTCPFDDWTESKNVTIKDKAAIDTVIEAVECTEGLFPPEKVKKYKGTNPFEVKARGPGKQLRPLAIMDGPGKRLIIMCGAIEKDGELDNLAQAQNLAARWEAGEGSVKDYWED